VSEWLRFFDVDTTMQWDCFTASPIIYSVIHIIPTSVLTRDIWWVYWNIGQHNITYGSHLCFYLRKWLEWNDGWSIDLVIRLEMHVDLQLMASADDLSTGHSSRERQKRSDKQQQKQREAKGRNNSDGRTTDRQNRRETTGTTAQRHNGQRAFCL